MPNQKSYFGIQNGSSAICNIGVVTIKQFEPTQYAVKHGLSTVNVHRGRATKLYSFFVVRVCETF